MSQQVSLKLACPLTLIALPFDVQSCTYMMGLYAHSRDQVVLTWRTGRDALDYWKTTCIAECALPSSRQRTSPREPSSHAVGAHSHPRTTHSSVRRGPVIRYVATTLSQDTPMILQEGDTYSFARANVTFARRGTPLMLNYFLPVSGLTFMSMLSFWIDAEAAPARVALAVIWCVHCAPDPTALMSGIVGVCYQPACHISSRIAALSSWPLRAWCALSARAACSW
jgi:hypothetical protein